MTEKDKYNMISFICGIQYKLISIQNLNRLTDIKQTCLPKGKGEDRDKLGAWDKQKQITAHKLDKQQGFTV